MEKKYKVIFLDIDGVLNSYESFNSFGSWHTLCPNCVRRLEALVKDTKAKVVMSSAWRLAHSLPYIRRLLAVSGLSNSERVVIGATPIMYLQPHGRGREIDAWLKSNEEVVENFVIIDDSTDMYPHMDRLVKTDPQIGFSLENVESVKRMLT